MSPLHTTALVRTSTSARVRATAPEKNTTTMQVPLEPAEAEAVGHRAMRANVRCTYIPALPSPSSVTSPVQVTGCSSGGGGGAEGAEARNGERCTYIFSSFNSTSPCDTPPRARYAPRPVTPHVDPITLRRPWCGPEADPRHRQSRLPVRAARRMCKVGLGCVALDSGEGAGWMRCRSHGAFGDVAGL